MICVSSAVRLVQETGCDGIMIGRGALQDPLVFHRIRSHFAQQQQQHQHQQHQQQQHQQQQQPAYYMSPTGAVQVTKL